MCLLLFLANIARVVYVFVFVMLLQYRFNIYYNMYVVCNIKKCRQHVSEKPVLHSEEAQSFLFSYNFKKKLVPKSSAPHMLRPWDITYVVQPQDWFLSVALRDTFFFVPISPEHRWLLRIVIAIQSATLLRCGHQGSLSFGRYLARQYEGKMVVLKILIASL